MATEANEELSDFLYAIFVAIGVLFSAKYVISILNGIFNRLFRGGKNIKKTFGSWAVVTGATDGIGKAMAFELARKGVNIVLISRSIDKLDATAKELKEDYSNVEVKVLAIDYGNFDNAARDKVKKMIADLDVGVLINNVGISYPYTKYFHELTDENVEQLMTLNVNSTTWMTRIVLPGMLSRNKGAIVNIGSAAGVSVSPLLSQYGAAKSYITMFSKALNVELKNSNIHVQCQVPMFVATKLAKIKNSSLFVASPSGYAKAAVAAIGYEDVISPYWTHALQIWFLTNLPDWLVATGTLSMHHGIRKAGMKKDAKLLAEAKKK